MTITLTKIRDLTLSAAADKGRPAHMSAASGLVCLQSYIYVVADDELHLGVFRAEGSEPGHLVRLFEGELPNAKSDRKRQKPDLEALVLLPAHEGYPHGALLAFSSGSTPARRSGALLRLDSRGAVDGPPRAVDLAPLLAPLDDAFSALNIEGAVVCGDELRLLQRGNRKHAGNAIIHFPLAAVLGQLGPGRTGTVRPSAINVVDLGRVDGIPLGFTDAAALPGGAIVFTAVAEDTGDPYDDGPCAGAAIGIADQDGRVRSLYPLDQPHKIEGVSARMDGDVVRLLLVTDADDAAVPAGLFSATIK